MLEESLIFVDGPRDSYSIIQGIEEQYRLDQEFLKNSENVKEEHYKNQIITSQQLGKQLTCPLCNQTYMQRQGLNIAFCFPCASQN